MDSDIRDILQHLAFAVVGCSPRPERPSHYVSEYLMSVGYTVVPVNPGYSTILGRTCYPNLLEIPEPVDVVVIFRRSEHVFPIVQDAINIRAKAVWMQDGVEHYLAFEAAAKAGLEVDMNDCVMRRHQDFGGPFLKTITTC